MLNMLLLLVAAFGVCSAGKSHKNLGGHASMLHRDLVHGFTQGHKIMDAVTIPSPIPVPNGTYTETGFFYLSNSYSSDCSNPFLTYGIPVDHCIIDVGYAYKFQLVEDSCVGGIVQYFKDEECTIYAGSTDLEPQSNNCSLSTNNFFVENPNDLPVYTNLMCTSSATPRVPVDSGIMEFFDNTTTCDTAASYAYVSYTVGPCITVNDTSFTVDCSTGSMVWNIETDNFQNCSGASLPYPWDNQCVETANDDDDGGDDDDTTIYNPKFIQPPPSVSTTPFPTSMGFYVNDSQLTYCQTANSPSAEPSAEPTAAPTAEPTTEPTAEPTAEPTQEPTAAPSGMPTNMPSTAGAPTATPTATPSAVPSATITGAPSAIPSALPSASPTVAPSAGATGAPTASPTGAPTAMPSAQPSAPSATPTAAPTATPSAKPTASPSADPSAVPSAMPTARPTTPTANPTAMPSAEPTTAYPTAPTATLVQFNANQNIIGISLTTYNSDVALYSMTLAQSIAATMIGVPYTDIINMVAQDVTTAAAKLRLRVQDSAAIAFSYTVSTTTAIAASDLEAQLTTSVDSGVFNTIMQSYATTNGATALETATSDPVTITPYSSGGDGGSKGLSDGAIAGIVIGCIAGAFILVGAVYYFVFSAGSKSLLNAPNLEL